MTFCVASLSTKSGWETKSPQEALALHFTYWFASRRSQGKVLVNTPSFYYLWKQYGESPDKLVEETKNELENYLKELFPQCSVNVVKELMEGQLHNYRIIIGAQVAHNGYVYDLGQSVVVTGEGYKVLDQARIK
ncbi:MAG: hypothetical protein WBK76_01840 [Candidatus Saccharimonadales bacterium]